MSRDEYFIIFIRQFDDKCDWRKRCLFDVHYYFSCDSWLITYSIYLLRPDFGKRDLENIISIDGR